MTMVLAPVSVMSPTQALCSSVAIIEVESIEDCCDGMSGVTPHSTVHHSSLGYGSYDALVPVWIDHLHPEVTAELLIRGSCRGDWCEQSQNQSQSQNHS